MAGAGYKLFSTGDVLSASDVNTYLQQQTVMVFASAAARTTALASVLAEGMVTYLKDTDVVEIYTGAAWVSLDDPNAIQNSIVTAKGDIIGASAASTPARLATGTTGQVLTVDTTTATGLKWATPSAGGGKVLQVVNARFVTSASNSTSTYAATGIALSITPSAATSKILILGSINIYKSDTAGATQNSVGLRLLRDSTMIDQIAELGLYDSNAKPGYGDQSVNYLDSPSTTSAVSYNFTFANVTGNVSNVKVNADGQMSSTVTLLEIGA